MNKFWLQMAKTRGQIGLKLRDLVGPGKEFLPSDVPTLRGVMQRGLLIKERLMLEEGRGKKQVQVSEIVEELVPLIEVQWQNSNPRFCPPVTIQGYSLRKKLEKLWGRVEKVAHGIVRKSEKDKVMDMLDKVLDITTCSCKIALCDEPDSGCKGEKQCKVKAHISCSCPLQNKVPIMELLWLAKQRAKIGDKSELMMDRVDKVESERQLKAFQRKSAEVEAALKRQRKQEEEAEILLQQQAAADDFLAELEENEPLSSQEAEEFEPRNVKSKEQEKEECRQIVDTWLASYLGDKIGLVTRYLDRPQSKNNTMPLPNTARASIRSVQNQV